MKADPKLQKGARQIRKGDRLPVSRSDSSLRVWHAGLGALARADKKFFDRLVKQGKEAERRTRNIDKRWDTTAARAKIAEKWKRVNQGFADREAQALNHLGVYTNSDQKKLARRMDRLEKKVQRMADLTRNFNSRISIGRRSKAAKIHSQSR